MGLFPEPKLPAEMGDPSVFLYSQSSLIGKLQDQGKDPVSQSKVERE